MSYKKVFSFLIVFFWFNISGMYAQDQKIADSLALIYQQNKLSGIAKFELLRDLSYNETRDLQKGLKYAEELIKLSEQAEDHTFLRAGYFLRGTKNRSIGNLDEALEAYFKSAEIARESRHLAAEGESYGAIADTYSEGKNYTNAKHYYLKAIIILRQSKPSSQIDSINLASVISNVGEAYRNTNNYDSALLYFNEAKLIFDKVNYQVGIGYCLGNIGMVYASIGKKDLAENNINQAIRILEQTQDYYPICDYLISMADVYLDKGDNQRALTYVQRSLHLAEQNGLKSQIENASLKLSEFYENQGDKSEAFKYYKKHILYRDSVIDRNTVEDMANLRTNFEVSQKQIELNQQKQKQKILVISLSIILGLTIIILTIILKNNQNKQKAYKILNYQKQKTDEQKAKAEGALAELQVTQKQLIQSAKMASLGELTAGIAHEIQNPLNFVNNFSEVSVELLSELRDGTLNNLTISDKAEVDEIINNLTENLKKITDHGKRADSIVKGMLQHSRTSTGTKEATDINGLADEYLRLSYHGLRAKDKEFNANFTTNFDESIGKVEVIPQDIGRVLLNLYNNAFYAVNKKKNVSADSAGQHYEPTVSVTTKRIGNKVELSIKDNGIGIPKEVLDKVFQPFFTTKPTGQGTGLGLSLSYDIIKAHGGDLKVETKEGEFAEFIIRLPIGSYNGTLM
jgi:signal transduction histidine kinase